LLFKFDVHRYTTELAEELSRRLEPAVVRHLTMTNNKGGGGSGRVNGGTGDDNDDAKREAGAAPLPLPPPGPPRINVDGCGDRFLRVPCFINRRFRVYRLGALQVELQL
jgi:hypothetical protein